MARRIPMARHDQVPGYRISTVSQPYSSWLLYPAVSRRDTSVSVYDPDRIPTGSDRRRKIHVSECVCDVSDGILLSTYPDGSRRVPTGPGVGIRRDTFEIH